MSYPGLTIGWLMDADDRVIDTIIDLNEEAEENA